MMKPWEWLFVRILCGWLAWEFRQISDKMQETSQFIRKMRRGNSLHSPFTLPGSPPYSVPGWNGVPESVDRCRHIAYNPSN